ncbi:hypothetical protein [Bifidobacterium sp. SO1]|uniref:hypothetical protein n=1 Tax=Bifidobacterium sp. SO1 TaxID=2809029 RepID=UPI001BDD4D08|nr:hypothetical protein [Bifidobacterium sp. SO1]MBT1162579.1 hypothetical protein [Bifidobacterium sp. SO1]
MNKLKLAEHVSPYFIHNTDEQETMFDYCYQHSNAAIETMSHNGTLLDLDCIVELERTLGIPVSWTLYTYINAHVSGDLLALCEDPSQAEPILSQLVLDYTNRM